VTWNGGNSVTVIYNERGAVKENVNATPLAANHTFMVFATTQDASKYIDSLDKSHYLWSDRSYEQDANGTLTAIRTLGTPSVYQNWFYVENTPIHKFGNIYQWDNIVEISSAYELS
jgi:hypothetical protein